MEIPKLLKDEIWDYCRLNNITNIDDFTIKLVKQGFTIEKFGATPTTTEKIVEKIIEVDKIIEVEKIVEKIVEVPVEKEVYVTDDTNIKQFTEEITRLEQERDKYKEESAHWQTERHATLQLLEIEKKKNKLDIYGE
jgi:hypothetical protein